jgi:hypothetical protein
MGKEARARQINPPNPRRSFFYRMLYNKLAYSEDELRFRSKILTLREASGLDKNLLETNEPWFSEDPELAFEIDNNNAWFLETTYRPRSHITLDKFIAKSPTPKVSWQSLIVLRRRIADFLIDRSQSHPEYMLNEPIHFFYLDLMQILERLALSNDADYVGAQLPRISHYIVQVSSLIPNHHGADKLFIDDCRIHINNVLNNDIAKVIDSTKLNNILSQTQTALQSLGQDYHTILHFSYMSNKPLSDQPYWHINTQKVNEHPYFELFQDHEKPDSQHLFPTSIGQDCLSENALQILDNNDFADRTYYTTALPKCPDLPFHPDLTVEQKELYLKNLKQLEELVHFKQMLLQVQKLMEQTGELFTIMMFRQELLNLFDQIDQYFIQMHQSMSNLLDDNEALYHESIIQRQTLSWWKHITSNRQLLLDSYIANQEKLNRHSINKNSLDTRRKKVTDLLSGAVNQLRSFEMTQDNKLLYAKHEVNQLLSAIYDWRINQHQLMNLPMPEKPKFLIAHQPNTVIITDESPIDHPILLDDSIKDSSELLDEFSNEHDEPIYVQPQPSAIAAENENRLFLFQPTAANRLPITNSQTPLLAGTTPSSENNSQMIFAGVAIGGLIFLALLIVVYCYKKASVPSRIQDFEEEQEKQEKQEEQEAKLTWGYGRRQII